MVTVRCGYCHLQHEVPLLEAHGCPNCSMSSGYSFVDATKGELVQLQHLLDQAAERYVTLRPALAGAVMPRWRNWIPLDEALLDLLVIVFDHIALDINMLDRPQGRLRDKVFAYHEFGCLSLVDFTWDSWHGNEERYGGLPVLALTNVLNDSGVWSSLNLIDIAADLRTVRGLRLHGSELRLAIDKLRAANSEDDLISVDPVAELVRANRLVSIARVLGSSALADPVCRPLLVATAGTAATEYAQLQDQNAVFAAAAWYSKQLLEVPNLAAPETLLRFREDSARADFVNVLINEVAGSEEETSALDLTRAVERTLTRRLGLARKLSGRSVRLGVNSISGVTATLGGAVGGPGGAILGGIAGHALGEVAEARLKRSIAPWTSYFMH